MTSAAFQSSLANGHPWIADADASERDSEYPSDPAPTVEEVDLTRVCQQCNQTTSCKIKSVRSLGNLNQSQYGCREQRARVFVVAFLASQDASHGLAVG